MKDYQLVLLGMVVCSAIACLITTVLQPVTVKTVEIIKDAPIKKVPVPVPVPCPPESEESRKVAEVVEVKPEKVTKLFFSKFKVIWTIEMNNSQDVESIEQQAKILAQAACEDKDIKTITIVEVKGVD